MTRITGAYLDAADVAVELLNQPAVAERWEEPSALAEWSVGGLAGHLAWQVFFIPAVLDEPAPTQQVIGLDDYYARVRWIDAGLHDEANARIRRGGEDAGAEGVRPLADRAADTVRALRTRLPAEPDRAVRLPVWGDYALSLDDFLTTRLMELVVHTDDLASSVGIPTPELPGPAVEASVGLLTRLALRRHGQSAVLRALSRAERAPSSVAAF
ncbi:maleylpyruvate isomerase N-terminal domain-containing protein [Streptomyces sp. NPDC051913]|uniref:maleylpyruvate isomerase N-terminal domain-containing protein n=1 Tax=Streptomyces sp. NPDC051913 TaxID=3365676 RepID=UPI0037D440F3